MLNSFSNYLQFNCQVSNNDAILLAVSGGVDSIVLCNLFHLAKQPFGIAHCNFKLRGKASDQDEFFVKTLAQKLQVPFFSISFETQKIAKAHRQSIQIAARELRYEWLENTRQTYNYQFIATAHHLNDSLETVLYNFTKGCGIRGLHGILPRANKLIRPLLFAAKKDVVAFAKKEHINYREDASNQSDKYARNQIRHHVIPILEKINPKLEETTASNLERLRETEALYDFAIQKIQTEILEKTNGEWRISIQKLQTIIAPKTVLFETLRPLGFNNSQTAQMLQSMNAQAGKLFFSPTHEVLIDRNYLIARRIRISSEKSSFQLDFSALLPSQIHLPNATLHYQKLNSLPTSFSRNPKQVWLDYGKLQSPLTLRRWCLGDTFQPFGMKGKHKKLQDFFSDLKLSRFEKEQVWILESGSEICWIVGYRADERFKIDNQTQEVLFIDFKPNTFAPSIL